MQWQMRLLLSGLAEASGQGPDSGLSHAGLGQHCLALRGHQPSRDMLEARLPAGRAARRPGSRWGLPGQHPGTWGRSGRAKGVRELLLLSWGTQTIGPASDTRAIWARGQPAQRMAPGQHAVVAIMGVHMHRKW